jgi:hypothetical protein
MYYMMLKSGQSIWSNESYSRNLIVDIIMLSMMMLFFLSVGVCSTYPPMISYSSRNHSAQVLKTTLRRLRLFMMLMMRMSYLQHSITMIPLTTETWHNYDSCTTASFHWWCEICLLWSGYSSHNQQMLIQLSFLEQLRGWVDQMLAKE